MYNKQLTNSVAYACCLQLHLQIMNKTQLYITSVKASVPFTPFLVTPWTPDALSKCAYTITCMSKQVMQYYVVYPCCQQEQLQIINKMQ